MDFDFLFQNFEGVLSLTKRKAKVLTFFSLAGLLIAVIITFLFAFNIDKSKYIPGVIVIGIMLVLNVIFLIQGSYNSAVRVNYLFPLALYFLYINSYYAISVDDQALIGMLSMIYCGLVYLIIFSYSIYVFLLYYGESLITLLYFLYVNDRLSNFSFWGHRSVISNVHPVVELTIVALIAVLIYKFYDNLITKTARENYRSKTYINELMRQFDSGIMILEIQRDELGEKSGMLIKRTNNAFNRIFKVTSEEVVNVDFSIIFPKIFQDSFNWQDVFFHSSQSKLRVHIKHLEQWFIINNMHPEPDVTVCVFNDITHYKQESNRYKIRQDRLTSLMGSLPDIFFIIEHDGTYIDYVSNNPELMKISQKDIIGRTIFEMGFSKPMSYQIYSSIQYVLEKDNIETIEYGMELSSGKTLIFEMRLARLNETQVISIGRDITAKKEHEQQLIESRRMVEEASRLKASFLENISHEMRTPMNAILGFSSMAATGRYSDAEQKNFLDIVMKNGEHLMDIITNVIDIAEIEAGSIMVKMDVCLINEVFSALHERFSKIINKQSKNIDFEFIPGSLELDFKIYTDSNLLIKIMTHLIDNAIKFTPKGKVVFGYELTNRDIKVFVEDTGIGIHQKYADTIFEHFQQADNRLTRKYSGTGSGLAIAKSFTELLGGNLEFNSKEDKGSRFYFFLPINSFLKILRD